MRTAFIKQLVEEAKNNEKIFLIVGDLGYNVVEEFRENFPDRFLDIGINEQSMIGFATGLSMQGYNVYVYSIGNFPTLRCMEQIRYDAAYHNANIKIVSVGAGYAYGSLGASHHATEELGMIRTIPNMVICSPCDPSEAKMITCLSAKYDGPMYIRLGKAGEKTIYESVDLMCIGNLHEYRTLDSSNVILSTGSIMDYVVDWVKKNNVYTAIYSIPFVKPINEEQLISIAEHHQNIIVVEEHQKSCGVGSAIVEILNDMYSKGKLLYYPKVRRIAINDQFCSISGNQQYLREQAGLVLLKEYFI